MSIKYRVNPENGNGPEQYKIIDSTNPFGITVRTIYGTIDIHYDNKEEFLKYCTDSLEDAIVMREQILRNKYNYHKSQLEKYQVLLKQYEKPEPPNQETYEWLHRSVSNKTDIQEYIEIYNQLKR